jgi:hypothetical protein
MIFDYCLLIKHKASQVYQVKKLFYDLIAFFFIVYIAFSAGMVFPHLLCENFKLSF